MVHDDFEKRIRTCVYCAQVCEYFANQFAGNFASFVRLCLDTAGLCWSSAAFLSRRSHFYPELCRLTAQVCEACADECQKSPDLTLLECADACRQCADECQKAAEETPPDQSVVQGSGVSSGSAPTV